MSVKHGYYGQFYSQKSLSENIHFQIYSNKDYLIDLSSTLPDLRVVMRKKVRQSNSHLTDGLSYKNYILHNLFGQICVYKNVILVSTSNNLSNYASYIKFMLITPMSYKKLIGLVMGYDYRSNADADGELTWVVSKQYYLVVKLNHEIFNIPQWMPPNIKIDIKLQLASSNFILRKHLMVQPI